ncbi:SagB-type dehydrogenase family enzyme [Sinobacterium caligoides]|uniref:SagB-type dehydrogenase family enzyme n=1 Tax=Sinobacterium caligoides TaxID=933926 RepID=A0A3N2DMR0_9GAMM|nr:SagB family peptide dehydrogenase [Sinobacterium caligoides]ROS01088.1 SagB-type dehydrogenase family enzyme [Sinobacterium caligoides]
MKIINDFFIYFEEESLTLWNYKTHEQFEIAPYHVGLINDFIKGKEVPEEFITEMSSAGLIGGPSELTDNWNWDVLSKIFHVGTKNIPISSNNNQAPEEWIKEYLEYCEEIGDAPERPLEERLGIPLPKVTASSLKSISLFDVFHRRKTSRVFNGQAISIEKLSNILFYSFGYIHESWDKEFDEAGLAPTAKRKSSPSGGGLHPIDAYVTVFNVNGIAVDIYKYDPDKHSLIPVRSEKTNLTEELTDILWGQYYSEGISFGVFLTAQLDRAAWKYKHSRAYRNVLLDAGHLSQSFQLTATAEGLNTWITGAFNDSRIEEVLDIDGINDAVIFYVAAGMGSSSTFDDKMRVVVSEYS